MSLSARDLVVRLGARLVLDRVAIALATGRLVALAGPNGAGKSTLLRALAGLLVPAEGVVTIDGRPLAALDRQAAARRIAFLPQERTVHWSLSSRAVVGLGRLPHQGFGGEGPADRRAIETALAAMDATALAGRPVLELSGGERARVLIARALAQEPDYLLADEPAAGLDPAHQLALFAHLARLAAGGTGILVALHDLSLAARFCHEVVLMKAGRIVAAGPAREVVAPGPLAETFDVAMAVGEVGGVPAVVAAGEERS